MFHVSSVWKSWPMSEKERREYWERRVVVLTPASSDADSCEASPRDRPLSSFDVDCRALSTGSKPVASSSTPTAATLQTHLTRYASELTLAEELAIAERVSRLVDDIGDGDY